MARINIEQKALSDRRFQTLGRLTGETRHAALGRMALVWNECQERETYILTSGEIDDTSPDLQGFSDAVVASGLARHEDGGIYICGTRGRIEWLAKRRKEGREATGGGRPSHPIPSDGAETPRGLPEKTPPSPALDSSGSNLSSPQKEDHGSKTFSARERAKAKKPGNGHGGKGEDGIGERQFAFIASLVKPWDTTYRELNPGGATEAYIAAFNRQNFGVSFKKFEQLRKKYVDSS